MKDIPHGAMPLSPPTKPYDERLVECEKLGLIETITHGGHQYGRLTDLGINVLDTLARLTAYRSDPKNKLRVS